MTKIDTEQNNINQLQRALLALKEMRGKLEAIERAKTEPIAVIGMACRFPGGADNPDAFWQILQHGVDTIQEIPQERWDTEAYYSPNPDAEGKSYIRYGGFLKDIDLFDANFFEISPREAVSTDPQQRLLLEVSWEALENAGQCIERLSQTQTGVFIGVMNNDYSRLYSGNSNSIDTYFGTGNSFSFISGRLSYILGLQGPSLVVDTACSSSLVSLHLACQSLRSGECDQALAGGVNLILSPDTNIFLSKMRAVAPDGRCKSFDASADGYTRGEGCGVLVLKRLSDAVAAGDSILALIKGSAVNHDGPSGGLTVPSGPAQQKLLRQALANSRVAPQQVSYIEAHGTGTPLGDPIEINALASVLCEQRSFEQPLVVGSVKTNIGHLEAAAGVAGVIKVILSLQHQKIPPHLHLKQPNPHIPWQELPLAIPTTAKPWHSENNTRIAGVSSFGLSGTNAHVVIEAAPLGEAGGAGEQGSRGAREQGSRGEEITERPLHLLTLSAKHPQALQQLAQNYIKYLSSHPDIALGNITFTSQVGRTHFSHRLAIIAADHQQMQQQLQAYLSDTDDFGIHHGHNSQQTKKIAFLFTGQGSQYRCMGRQLYETQPSFRLTLDKCDTLLRPLLGESILSVIFCDNSEGDRLNQTVYTQVALFVIEYGLAQLWLSWGIHPTAVVGHSVGEYVAACIAGIFSLEDALKLIVQRASLMQALPQGGGMAAVFTTVERVTPLIADYCEQLSIAAINGEESIVLSGELQVLNLVLQKLESQGIETRKLQVSHAFHSPLMQPMLAKFEQVAATVKYQQPKLDIVSNVTGKIVRHEEMSNAAYWVEHIRASVQFAASMQVLYQAGYEVFVEIGPHPTLLGMARRECPEVLDEQGLWLASLRKGKEDWQQLLDSVAQLYVTGVEIDWQEFESDYARNKVILPNYPWQRQRYWLPTATTTSLPAELQDWLYEVQWQPQTLSDKNTAIAPAHWLILSDRTGVADKLAQLLAKQGHTYTLVFSGDCTHFEQLLDGIPTQSPLQILHLWSLDDTKEADLILTNIQNYASAVLHLIQALASRQQSISARLWLVTQGTQVIGEHSGEIAIAAAPLWGLGGVIAMEYPEIWGGLVDLDPSSSPADAAALLLAKLPTMILGDRIAWRHQQWHTARLVRSQISPVAAKSLKFTPEGTYLIAGGLGALGLQIARWCVEQGARHLVLLGRSSPSESAQATIRELEQTGTQITVVQADIAQAEQLQPALTALQTPPLRGIIHAAGVLDDGMLLQQNWERFARVMAPKIQGAWNLHTLTLDQPLDFFVLFSSTACILGAPGQSNYAAANAFLDALAHYRQKQGLVATSINWGPWAEVGMAASFGQRLAAEGIDLIPPNQALQLLRHFLQQRVCQVTVLPINWTKFLQRFPTGQQQPAYFQELFSDGQQQENQPSELQQRLQATPVNEWKSLLVAHISDELTSILGLIPSQTLDPLQGFATMGMDSLTSVEFRNRLQKSLGKSLPSTLTFNYPNIDALASYFVNTLDNQNMPPETKPTLVNPSQSMTVTQIKQLSEEQVESMIDEELASLMEFSH
ncbi:type I polyketide synthase [Nostoc sp. C057]|uniref:type I polyketide synthase n=1 Tax=Nostoc sp. C057 TaxID=2576903 RepID=UPI0015C2C477|nr:type I polyketide synthase [Nostoc sp. C057]QLE49244.1 type I polyketide synthase [Nostoc sp. C057]